MAAKDPNKLRKIENSIESAKTAMDVPVSMLAAAATNKIKVIDMTGKEQRVMHGYEALGQMSKMAKQSTDEERDKRPRHFDMPELVHNINMLIDMTEEKILVADKKIKHYEDSLVSLAYDERRTQERLLAEKKQLKKMNDLLAAVERFF